MFLLPILAAEAQFSRFFNVGGQEVSDFGGKARLEPSNPVVGIPCHFVFEFTTKNRIEVQRVIGLPGDDIMITSDDQLYINGEEYHEDYLKDGFTPAFEIPPENETYTVPEGTYYCMGDNRMGSVDSRRKEVGVVPRDAIKGKVIIRLFPFNQIQRF
jgi:signal peptidase I